MFVDEFIFGVMNDNEYWWVISHLISIFIKALGPNMSDTKSCLVTKDPESPHYQEICSLFGIKATLLNFGIIYLGFPLKIINRKSKIGIGC